MAMREGKEREGRKEGESEEEREGGRRNSKTYREGHTATIPLSHDLVAPLFLAPQILGYFDYAFTSIFTVEILLKV